MNIGKAIKELRKEKGITQIEMSKKIGTSQTAISQIESNESRPHESTLKRIAKALKVSVGLIYLLAIDESEIRKGRETEFDLLYPTIRDLLFKLAK